MSVYASLCYPVPRRSFSPDKKVRDVPAADVTFPRERSSPGLIYLNALSAQNDDNRPFSFSLPPISSSLQRTSAEYVTIGFLHPRICHGGISLVRLEVCLAIKRPYHRARAALGS